MFSLLLTSMILVLVVMVRITGGDSIMERLAIHEHFSQVCMGTWKQINVALVLKKVRIFNIKKKKN